MISIQCKKIVFQSFMLLVTLAAGHAFGLNDTKVCQQAMADTAEVLETYCASCHGEQPNYNGLAKITDLQSLINRGLIVPGDSESSILYQRVRGGTMPPASVWLRPEIDAVDTLRDWIECAAPELSVESAAYDFVDINARLNEIRSDLQNTWLLADRWDQRYISFYSLSNAGMSEDQLELYRQATIYMLNSVSRSILLLNADPSAHNWVDENRLLYRFNLSDLGWDAELFDQVIELYPYKITYDEYSWFNVDESTAESIREQIGSDVFELHADWVLANFSQSPLYEILLDLPSTLAELEQQRGIDVLESLYDLKSRRFGVFRSGYANGPRVVESIDGYLGFWLTYDFAEYYENNNPFLYPLDFEADGGEVIFELNNGLFGYYVFTGDPLRENAEFTPVAPIDIAHDPFAHDGLVTNGRSCMSCHVNGLIARSDEVRDYLFASGNIEEDAFEIYLDRYEMSRLLEEQNIRFSQAMSRAGLTLITDSTMRDVYKKYALSVSVDSLAGTLGVRSEDLEMIMNQNRHRLPLEILPILYRNSAIDREVIEANFGEIIKAIGLGYPR